MDENGWVPTGTTGFAESVEGLQIVFSAANGHREFHIVDMVTGMEIVIRHPCGDAESPRPGTEPGLPAIYAQPPRRPPAGEPLRTLLERNQP